MTQQNDHLKIGQASAGDMVTSADLGKRYPEGSVERQNIELQQAYFTAARKGDWDKVASLLTPDFALVESPVLPFRGVWKGAQGLQDLRAKINGEVMDVIRNNIYSLTAGGEYVVALMKMYARDSDGSEIEMKVSESFHWVDGKLQTATPYWFDIMELQRAVDAKKKRSEQQ